MYALRAGAAAQICHEFERFSTYMPEAKTAVFYGGVPITAHKDLLKARLHSPAAPARAARAPRRFPLSFPLLPTAASPAPSPPVFACAE